MAKVKISTEVEVGDLQSFSQGDTQDTIAKTIAAHLHEQLTCRPLESLASIASLSNKTGVQSAYEDDWKFGRRFIDGLTIAVQFTDQHENQTSKVS
jgi:hypothetical protein